MKSIILTLVLVSAAVSEDITANVKFYPNDANSDVVGNFKLVQDDSTGEVRISGTVTGLTPGDHGIHVHEKGNLSNGCNSAGRHFNPTNQNHGGRMDDERHVGDLGNFRANESGVVTVNITDSVISLCGPDSIIGRSIVIHSGKDDLGKGGNETSLTSGNSGSRVACGIIRIA